MKIKKIIAKDIKEGKRRVLEELGEDAVILSNRAVKDADGSDAVEIVAALDENSNKLKTAMIKEITDNTTQNISKTNKINIPHNNEILLQEIDNLKLMLLEINESIKYRNTSSMSPVYAKLYKKMRTLDINDDIALKVINRISGLGNLKDYDEVLFEARKILLENIEIDKTIQKGTKTKIILFTGTTGSGKTASLVKLAIISKIVQNANSLIISADTYKVGAAEQLETYASIASIQFKAAYTNEDLANIIQENLTKDFIFIDTTGFSQKDTEQLNQLNEIIKLAKPDYIYLTIPATISELHANSIFMALRNMTIDSVIITKTDESESIGSLINIIRNYKLPISYITNGIKIPEDILPADRVILGKLCLNN
ncbi:flagellar biosynthesis protein FlhF [Candidatus Kapaibacterium sp.]